MSDMMSLISAEFNFIVSVLTVEQSLASVLSFTASALKYFYP